MKMMHTLQRLTGLLLLVVLTTPLMRAQTVDRAAATMLETAIQAEIVDGDLDRAIELYRQILTRFANARAVAAQALLHLGQCYEQRGDPQARQTYQRLLREYGDQSGAVGIAQTRLAALEDAPTGIDPTEVLVRDVSTRPSAPIARGDGDGGFVIFSDLAVHNVKTGENRRLTTAARSAAYPVVSPDGRQVAYLSWSGDLQQNLRQVRSGHAGSRAAGAELRMVGMDGKGDRLLARATDVPWLRPFAWSPDGRQILAVFERTDGSNEIALVSVADGSARVLKSLQWRAPQAMSFSPDGQYISYEVPSPRNAQQLDLNILPINGRPSTPLLERRFLMTLGGQRAATWSGEQQAIHVLNRLSFGPRSGDIERVGKLGIDAYIEEQLSPERIPDPVVDAKLSSFTSLKMTIPELLEQGGPVAPVGVRRRATVFERRAIVEHPAPGAAGSLSSAPLPAGEQARRATFQDRPKDEEIHTARILRAVYSERQLYEVMVDFWMNHFSINHGDHQLTANFEEDVVRRHTMGRFEDLLMAVAKHPRMMLYLDNWRSSAPADVIQKRVANLKATVTGEEYVALLERMPFLEGAKGLNENYARELMELHTLGVDGGYTQQDVVEVAKILTGWTISGRGIINGREDDGVFAFDPLLHVDSDKVVLGQKITSGGIEEGEALVKMLARHPATARFLATKLARRFVADDPAADVVDAASRTFQRTGGNIREVLRTIFASSAFRSPGAYRAKIKKPLELVVSSLRAVNAEFTDWDVYRTFFQNRRGILSQMGEKPYNYEAPDGNPDVGAAWMNSNALLVRLDFANALGTNRLAGVKSDVRAAQPLLEQLGLPRPTPAQIEQTRAMLQKQTSSALNAPSMSQNMMAGSSASDANAGASIDPAAIVVATMLGSPQFQKR